MKKLLSATAFALTLALYSFSGTAVANDKENSRPSSPIEKAISKLPKDKADNFRATMKQAHKDNQDDYAKIHQAHHDLHEILTADTFDQDGFIEKSRELRKLHDEVSTNLDAAFASAISKLSTSERLTLAKAMEQGHSKKAK